MLFTKNESHLSRILSLVRRQTIPDYVPHVGSKGKMILSKHPTEPKKGLARILISHAAPGFLAHLKLYLNSLLPPPQQVSKHHAMQGILPFTNLDIWHQYKFFPSNLFDDSSDSIQEIIKAVPIHQKSHIPRFDTVIILHSDEAESTAVQGVSNT